MKILSALDTRDTVLCADSVEFVPLKEEDKDWLVVGTYEVLEGGSSPTRTGRISLFSVDEDSKTLNLESELNTEAILDMKWSHSDPSLLGLVTSTGQIQLLKREKRSLRLMHTSLTQSIGNQTLNLSLDWSDRVNRSGSPHLIVSQSDGYLSYYSLEHHSSKPSLSPLQSWKANDFEAWIAAFDYWYPNVVYSGGDDSLFKGWDARTSCSIPIFTSKRHEAGVCSISSHHLSEHILATGSYDEHVRIWDTRNLKTEISSLNLGGGVWRLKWHPTNKDLLLVPCMYNGAHVIKFKDGSGDLGVLYSHTAHDSIVYGADWSFSPSESLVATCSFYDHSLHLWSVPLQMSDD